MFVPGFPREGNTSKGMLCIAQAWKYLTQQLSSICTPEPFWFNLSAQKTTISRNVTGLGLGLCSASQTKFLSNLSLLSVSTESIFFLRNFIFYFCFSVCRTACNRSVVFQLIQRPEPWDLQTSSQELHWHSRIQWTSSVATTVISDQSVTSGWATAVIPPISPAEGALRLFQTGLFTLRRRICAYNKASVRGWW